MAGASHTDNTVNETKFALITQMDARLQIPLILVSARKMLNGLELCEAMLHTSYVYGDTNNGNKSLMKRKREKRNFIPNKQTG